MPTAPSCPTTSYHNSSGRSLKRSRSLSLSLSALLPSAFGAYTRIPRARNVCSTGPLCSTLSPPPTPALARRFPLDSFPLRLVPEGNKDGSAYVQPATGGGARLPSVGRTNANDCSMQDGVGIHRAAPRHAIHHPSRRLYLACNAYPLRFSLPLLSVRFDVRAISLRLSLSLSLSPSSPRFAPLFQIPRKSSTSPFLARHGRVSTC